MDAFRFVPELFEVRTIVLERLTKEGFNWLSHYSSVAPFMTPTASKFAAFSDVMMPSQSNNC
jgi:hypothetical protein